MKLQITFICIILFLSWKNLAQDQPCDCGSELNFISNFIKENYPGYKDKVNSHRHDELTEHTSRFLAKADNIKKDIYCAALLTDWMSWFKDGHLQIHYQKPMPDQRDTNTLIRLMASSEKIPVPEKISDVGFDDIRGIYHISDTTYTILILEDKNEYRDYAGIILTSRADTWKRGMVKLELKKNGDNSFTGITYNRFHHPGLRKYSFSNGMLGEGEWIKTSIPQYFSSTAGKPPVYAESLSENTFYLAVNSFEDWNYNLLENVIYQHEETIRSTPNLILDIRGNGGGSDFVYKSLSPYLYTDTIKHFGVEVLATRENIKGWQQLFNDYQDIPDDVISQIQKIIDTMIAGEGKMVNIVPDTFTVLAEVLLFPTKVVVLIDGYCGSSAEEFILQARQSAKVTLMGTATAGVLDYANMRRKELPCMPLGLFYATTRSRRIDAGLGVDETGILPDIHLRSGDDWIEAARTFLEEN